MADQVRILPLLIVWPPSPKYIEVWKHGELISGKQGSKCERYSLKVDYKWL